MRNFMLVLSLLLLFVTPQTFTAQKQKVLVDKSHGQTHYTFTILQQYLDTYLNLQFEISEEPITIEKLSNVAVLFIPCPAQNTTFSDDELQAIKTFVNAGGGILITGESQYTYGGKNYTFGQPTTLNSILEALEINPGDLVGYTPNGEWEFLVEGKRLYCMKSNDIVIKYERQGNEEEYNPSWAASS